MSQSCRLSEIKKKQDALVVDIKAKTESQARRLIEMGLTVGTKISVETIAPFGGPIAFLLRGGKFAFRLDDANCVLVQPTLS